MRKLLSTICAGFVACSLISANVLPMSVYADEEVVEQTDTTQMDGDVTQTQSEDLEQSVESEGSTVETNDEEMNNTETMDDSTSFVDEPVVQEVESDTNVSTAQMAATTTSAYVLLEGESLATALGKEPVNVPLGVRLDTTTVDTYTGYVFKKAYVTDGTGSLIKNCSYLFSGADGQIYWHYFQNDQTPDELTGTPLGTDKVVLKYETDTTVAKHNIEVNIVNESGEAENQVLEKPDTFEGTNAFEIKVQNRKGYSVSVQAGTTRDVMADTGVTQTSQTITESVWGIDPGLMSLEVDSTVYVTVTFTKKDSITTSIADQNAPYWHNSDWYVSDKPITYSDGTGRSSDTGSYTTQGTKYALYYKDSSGEHLANTILSSGIKSYYDPYGGPTQYYHVDVNEATSTKNQTTYSLSTDEVGTKTLYYMLVVPQNTQNEAYYLLDGLEINDQRVEVPHTSVVSDTNNLPSVSTTLTSGEKVTVSLKSAIKSFSGVSSYKTVEQNGYTYLTNNWYVYYVTVENIYDDVTITAGNVRANSWAEVIPKAMDGINLKVLDGSSDVTNGTWKDFGTNIPFAYTSGSADNSAYAAYKVAYGYNDPVTIKVTGIDYSTGTEIVEAQFTIDDLSQLPATFTSSEQLQKDGVITSASGNDWTGFKMYLDTTADSQTEGYVIMEIPGFENNSVNINYVTLDIAASSKEYHVKYDTTTLLKELGGEASGGPTSDVSTYRTADNPEVIISKVTPSDVSGKNYVFKDWAVFPKGDTTNTEGVRRLSAGYTINNTLAAAILDNYTDADGNITLYAEWEQAMDPDPKYYSSYTITAYVEDDNPTATDKTVEMNGKTYKVINDSLVAKGYLTNQQRMMPNSTLVKFMDKLENYLNNSQNGFIKDPVNESYELDETLSNTEVTVDNNGNNEIALYYNLVSDASNVPTGSILPDLGGMGTQMFMISGAVLMLFAILLYKRKLNHNRTKKCK